MPSLDATNSVRTARVTGRPARRPVRIPRRLTRWSWKGAPSPALRQSLPFVGAVRRFLPFGPASAQSACFVDMHAEPVSLAPAPRVRLKTRYPCHGERRPTRSERRGVSCQTPNTSRQLRKVSKGSAATRCYSSRARRDTPPMQCGRRPVRFLPKISPHLWKTLWKQREMVQLYGETAIFSALATARLNPRFSGSRNHLWLAAGALTPTREAKALASSFAGIPSSWTPASGTRSLAGSKPKSTATVFTPGSSRHRLWRMAAAQSQFGSRTRFSGLADQALFDRPLGSAGRGPAPRRVGLFVAEGVDPAPISAEPDVAAEAFELEPPPPTSISHLLRLVSTRATRSTRSL